MNLHIPLKISSLPTQPFNPATGRLLQRKCACGGSPGPSGECAECRKKRLAGKSPLIQRKLTVNQPGDRYEQEADRVAEQVMRMPRVQRLVSPEEQEEEETIQTKPVAGQITPVLQRQAEPEEEEMLQAKSVTHPGPTGYAVQPALASQIHTLRGGGQPLDPATRAFMEPRFGHDFSQVRVHTDARAAETARAVNARAFTLGREVVFEHGQYAPGTDQGKRLLAHELTHVVQQSPNHAYHKRDAPETKAEKPAQIANVDQIPGARLQRLGNNPGCTDAQAKAIHQAIYDARGWVNKAIAKLETDPLSKQTLASLRRNFGPTYGVAADAPLIAGRLRTAYNEMSTIPYSCRDATDATCATSVCGYATGAGAHAAIICTNSTLATNDPIVHAGCVMHEALHAAYTNFTVDEYSGWHGHSSSSPTYPGTGTDPLLNADSYTTLAMDLS